VLFSAQDWDELETSLRSCKKCPLAENRTNVVVGEGNRSAELMFVGEAPGADEDIQGRPFVGKAGQLLDKIFEVVGLDRKEVYITNTVKCRPPGNRVPNNQEMTACAPFLEMQIELVNPAALIALGSTALTWFLGKGYAITKARGKWYRWRYRFVFAVFHPSYLLRNPSRKKGSPKWYMWQDMLHLMEVYGRIKNGERIDSILKDYPERLG